MTANSPPYVLQAGSHSAQLFRGAISTLIGAGGGIVGLTDYAVTQNGTPNMSVNIAAGQIWVPGTSSALQADYYGLNDAVVNLAIGASNPTNPRISIAAAQVQDAAYAGAVNSFSLVEVAGTPAASPVAPTLPASSLALANIAVAALATTIVTANITDKRVNANVGGVGQWVNLTPGTNVTLGPSYPAQSRLEAGNIIRLRGFLQASAVITATTSWGVVTAAHRVTTSSPSQSLGNMNDSTGTKAPVTLRVDSAGNIATQYVASVSTTAFLQLDGATYTL